MDDNGRAVTEFNRLLPSLRNFFECFRRFGLKLYPKNCEIAAQWAKFLGISITNGGISPQAEKNPKNSEEDYDAKDEHFKRLIGFAQFFRNFITNLCEKLIQFYKLLRKAADFEADETHYNALDTVKRIYLRQLRSRSDCLSLAYNMSSSTMQATTEQHLCFWLRTN